MECSSQRPERMYQSGRDEDQYFKNDENLYRRCCPEDVIGDRLVVGAIKFPDWSVNREKYSQPSDVLFPYFHDCCGIATFKVEDVPSKLESNTGTLFRFQVVHCPEYDNYAHSEVRTFKGESDLKSSSDEKFTRKLKPSRGIKKEFRTILSNKIIVTQQPYPDDSLCKRY